MKVYVVTKNGWESGYGAYIYLIGVFDNEQDAKNANGDNIECVEMNTTYPLAPSTDIWNEGEMVNDHLLGGYAE